MGNLPTVSGARPVSRVTGKALQLSLPFAEPLENRAAFLCTEAGYRLFHRRSMRRFSRMYLASGNREHLDHAISFRDLSRRGLACTIAAVTPAAALIAYAVAWEFWLR